MVFNPMALLQERQCAPIYEAIDSDRPDAALKHANQILSSQPSNHLAAALRALALSRTGKRKEANDALDKLVKNDEVLASASTINALSYTLNEAGRKADEATLLESASKAHPTSLDFGRKACLAFASVGEWQRLQQTALRISKLAASGSNKNANLSDLYFWWSMQAYSLISEDTALPGYQLALPLAQRMIAKHLETRPFGDASDEAVYLYVKILQKQGAASRAEALKFLSENENAKKLCKKAASLAELRRQLLEQQDQWEALFDEAVGMLTSGDRNWATVQRAVKAAIALSNSGNASRIENLAEKLTGLARDNKKDRTLRLAPFYLCKETDDDSKSEALSAMSKLADLASTNSIMNYFEEFATKGCTFEDLEPYARRLRRDDRRVFFQTLDKHTKAPPQGFTTLDEMYRCMNAVKLRRRVQDCSDGSAATEEAAAHELLELYKSALRLGRNLPKTEMQPADDFALMAAHALLLAASLARRENDKAWRRYYTHCVALLEVALQHSPKGYRLRILLIRVLLQFGAVQAAHEHYEEIGIKAVQCETLGWIISTRALPSLLFTKPSSDLERELERTFRGINSVWTDGRRQVAPIVAKTFEHGTFSRTEEMIDFGQRLEHSIAHRLHTAETYRARKCASIGRADMSAVEDELREAISARRKGLQHDQRDRQVLLDLLPDEITGGIFGRTAPVGAIEPDAHYVDAMLDVCAAYNGKAEREPLLSLQVDTPSLTPEEKNLHAIALSVSSEGSSQSPSLSKALDKLKELVDSSVQSDELPSYALQTMATAFEATSLASRADDSAAKASIDALRDATQAALGRLRKHTGNAVWSGEKGSSSSESISQQIVEIAATLSRTQDWVAEAPKTLQDGTLYAIDALEARISAMKS